MKLGEKIGAEKLVEYIKKFGIGQVSGVDLPRRSKRDNKISREYE